MTKPMFCPMAFANPQILTIKIDEDFHWLKSSMPKMECTPDCAWAKNDGKNYWCGHVRWEIQANNNTRPLNNDDTND